jgi:hypothetical protein
MVLNDLQLEKEPENEWLLVRISSISYTPDKETYYCKVTLDSLPKRPDQFPIRIDRKLSADFLIYLILGCVFSSKNKLIRQATRLRNFSNRAIVTHHNPFSHNPTLLREQLTDYLIKFHRFSQYQHVVCLKSTNTGKSTQIDPLIPA